MENPTKINPVGRACHHASLLRSRTSTSTPKYVTRVPAREPNLTPKPVPTLCRAGLRKAAHAEDRIRGLTAAHDETIAAKQMDTKAQETHHGWDLFYSVTKCWSPNHEQTKSIQSFAGPPAS